MESLFRYIASECGRLGMAVHIHTEAGAGSYFDVAGANPLNLESVLDDPGLRKTKFVIWRPLSSYRNVYEKALNLLEQAAFLDRRDVEVRNLSHGEQRQLEIVLGLASDPDILLLDEPAAGLSSGESAEMAKFLQALDPKMAILLIEHDMDVVFDVASEISVLHFGEVLESGSAERIRSSAKVQEIYLGTA